MNTSDQSGKPSALSANPSAAPLPDPVRDAIEAAVFRRLLAHLDSRKDVQNIDLMNLAGFCRNCLAKWYRSAAGDSGFNLTDDASREHIYGMPYGEWKALWQKEASPEQIQRFSEKKPD
jgi:hypothetical protein